MYHGNARIKRKIGRKGFYGEIELEVEFLKTLELQVSFSDELNVKWKAAIDAGIEYFFQKEVRPNKAGLEIRILKSRDMIIDSSFMVFFYLTYSALCEALGIENKIHIDEEGNFIVPK